MTQEVGPVLKQSFEGGGRYLEIVDAEKLVLRQKIKNKKSEYIISLLALNPQGKQDFQASWKLLIIGVILPVIIFVVYNIIKPELMVSRALTLGAIIIAGFCVTAFIKSISRNYQFFSRHSNIPVVEIFFANPDKEQYQSFVDYVEMCIREAQEAHNLSSNNQLAGEMRMLRRLESEGLIKKKIYEKAKGELLSLFGGNPCQSEQD
jgi:hypothetical protein